MNNNDWHSVTIGKTSQSEFRMPFDEDDDLDFFLPEGDDEYEAKVDTGKRPR